MRWVGAGEKEEELLLLGSLDREIRKDGGLRDSIKEIEWGLSFPRYKLPRACSVLIIFLPELQLKIVACKKAK